MKLISTHKFPEKTTKIPTLVLHHASSRCGCGFQCCSEPVPLNFSNTIPISHFRRSDGCLNVSNIDFNNRTCKRGSSTVEIFKIHRDVSSERNMWLGIQNVLLVLHHSNKIGPPISELFKIQFCHSLSCTDPARSYGPG